MPTSRRRDKRGITTHPILRVESIDQWQENSAAAVKHKLISFYYFCTAVHKSCPLLKFLPKSYPTALDF